MSPSSSTPLPVGWRQKGAHPNTPPHQLPNNLLISSHRHFSPSSFLLFQAEIPQGKDESRGDTHTPMLGAPPGQGEQQSPLQLPKSCHHSSRSISGLPDISFQLQHQGIYTPLQALKKICQQPLTLPQGSGSSSSGTASSKHSQGMQSTFQTKSGEFAALPAKRASSWFSITCSPCSYSFTRCMSCSSHWSVRKK